MVIAATIPMRNDHSRRVHFVVVVAVFQGVDTCRSVDM